EVETRHAGSDPDRTGSAPGHRGEGRPLPGSGRQQPSTGRPRSEVRRGNPGRAPRHRGRTGPRSCPWGRRPSALSQTAPAPDSGDVRGATKNNPSIIDRKSVLWLFFITREQI